MNKYKLDRENTALLIIDMQEKLAAVMNEDMLDTVVENTTLLVEGFSLMNLPIVESLQYPKGLGNTIDEIKEVLTKPTLTFEKRAFSSCEVKEFMEFLKNKGIKSVVIIGMEAHVCVLQTAVDLIEHGYNVHIVADAVISRNDFNWEASLDYMQSAGAIISVTETVLFQLLKNSDAKEFKAISELLK